ncbi:hypothetical protein JHK82_030313 [Glycine max]|uniref:Uncharacterized protein n=1 Tax=Glycine max TaxID=3847 RepID=A0A0R0HQR5_SOYBN|nr:hypothetical protein JHK87_030210 [Glycine soja]KAG4987961.1 hypothetical protein JHK85_030944 [Glycine max]KAG4993582.1 hypothetical protein JHK86_030409 [Glycine max]KAG5123576.1 hypothetical protein JHK82_030313 [Glycine max]KAG5145000.1 hypothetical protein JHK84_030543 [Glycine max]
MGGPTIHMSISSLKGERSLSPCDTVTLTTYSVQLCIDVTLITKEEILLIKVFKFNAHAGNYTYVGEHSILCLRSIAYGIIQNVA